MKKPTLMLIALMTIALLLGGCHPPNYNPPGGGNAAVWIEFPPNGQTLPDQPVTFVVYATDDGGVAAISLAVNGMPLPVQAPTRLSPDGYMVRLDQAWYPLQPTQGQYTLTASTSGASASVTFCIVTCQTPAEVETGPKQSEVYSAVTPTATLPIITLPPDAPTHTSTATPYTPLQSSTATTYTAPAIQPTSTHTAPPPPTKTPTPTTPPPADTSGPSINWSNLVWESCQFFGEAGISDPSGVSWAQFYYNKNSEGWHSVWMSELSTDDWQSDFGVSVDDGMGTPMGSIQYYIIASDSLGNQGESGTSSYSYTGCGG